MSNRTEEWDFPSRRGWRARQTTIVLDRPSHRGWANVAADAYFRGVVFLLKGVIGSALVFLLIGLGWLLNAILRASPIP